MAMRVTAILIGLAGLLVLGFPEFATTVIGAATGWWLQVLGAPVLWLSSAFLLLCLWLIVGPWGRLHLCPDAEAPEFGTVSWLSIRFAAGLLARDSADVNKSVAIAVGCKKYPLFSVCPAKSLIGDQPRPDAAAKGDSDRKPSKPQ
jgi:hypothetical protein